MSAQLLEYLTLKFREEEFQELEELNELLGLMPPSILL